MTMGVFIYMLICILLLYTIRLDRNFYINCMLLNGLVWCQLKFDASEWGWGKKRNPLQNKCSGLDFLFTDLGVPGSEVDMGWREWDICVSSSPLCYVHRKSECAHESKCPFSQVVNICVYFGSWLLLRL